MDCFLYLFSKDVWEVFIILAFQLQYVSLIQIAFISIITISSKKTCLSRIAPSSLNHYITPYGNNNKILDESEIK